MDQPNITLAIADKKIFQKLNVYNSEPVCGLFGARLRSVVLLSQPPDYRLTD